MCEFGQLRSVDENCYTLYLLNLGFARTIVINLTYVASYRANKELVILRMFFRELRQ